ncbi:MAG TPA: hypothetical protein GX513_08480, partial [Firmicutes bacterium]|nr:hypothetical protein [Bacillota bacterium]
PRLFEGTSEHLHRLTLGDVTKGFVRAWESRAACSFRDAFTRRHRWGTVEFIVDAVLNPTGASPPPAPAPCRHCYKLYGV